jgi:hypothetical protein
MTPPTKPFPTAAFRLLALGLITGGIGSRQSERSEEIELGVGNQMHAVNISNLASRPGQHHQPAQPVTADIAGLAAQTEV